MTSIPRIFLFVNICSTVSRVLYPFWWVTIIYLEQPLPTVSSPAGRAVAAFGYMTNTLGVDSRPFRIAPDRVYTDGNTYASPGRLLPDLFTFAPRGPLFSVVLSLKLPSADVIRYPCSLALGLSSGSRIATVTRDRLLLQIKLKLLESLDGFMTLTIKFYHVNDKKSKVRIKSRRLLISRPNGGWD